MGKTVDTVYCESCGELIKRAAEICPECGVRNTAERPNSDGKWDSSASRPGSPSDLTCNSCERYTHEPGSWYCQLCGEPRDDCAECGSDLDGYVCTHCDAVLEAPCKGCDEYIDVTKKRCPDCGYTPTEDAANEATITLGKLGGVLALLGTGLLVFLLIVLIELTHPVLAFLLFAPIVVIGGIVLFFLGGASLFLGSAVESRAKSEPAASLEKARTDNKRYNQYR